MTETENTPVATPRDFEAATPRDVELVTPREVVREDQEAERIKREKRNQRWIQVQQQAFTHWVNETVQKRGMQVTDITTDFNTGIILINFFELLSKKILRERYTHVPKNRIQCINNIHIALTFMERDMLVKNPGCSAEDIIDAEKFGNKMTLGLLYTLFRKYRMNPVDIAGEGKALKEEDALLQWVKQTTDGYPGVEITNYKRSFNDGKALLALCHAYSRLTGENDFNFDNHANQTPDEVIEFAFDYAQRNMGVDRLLEVDEVKEGNIDERALAIYVSLFHHAFKTYQELQEMKNELGACSGELEIQKKSKNDLVQMNLEMSKKIEDMTKRKEVVQAELDSLKQQIDEVNASNANKEKQISELDAKMEEYKRQITEFNSKLNDLNAQNSELEKKLKSLEEAHQDDDSKKNALAKELKEAKEELEKLEKEIELEKEMKNGADITSKFEEQAKNNKKLEEEVTELEEQLEEYDSVSKNLRKNLEDIEKDKDGVRQELEAISKEAEQYTGALAILRKQIELHSDDLQRWSAMQEGKSSVGDVDSVIMKFKSDNEDTPAQERIATLLGMLQKENEDIAKLYTDKLSESKQSGDAAEKKKKIVKKPVQKKK